MIPEFAVVGHPNEGKSSVVSTLTEDDQIKVSRTPGETVVSKSFTVKIDGEQVIRFVDTPGFQVPRQTLSWFKKYTGDPENIIDDFINAFKKDPFFADECELLRPIAKGAGIIYVVDASRPVREDDLAEMEILRLTGRPRMAIINSKTDEKDYTQEWKQEFRRQFNAIRVFNSNTACFSERIKMLESLKAIDQEWETRLSQVIRAFKKDWQRRNHLTACLISEAIEKCLSFQVSQTIREHEDTSRIEAVLNQKYQDHVKQIEIKMFNKIRGIFKHQLYQYRLPDDSVLKHDLFSKRTWELLGVSQKQLAAAGAIAGGTMGAVIDTAAAGITFGIFSAIGGLVGAGSTLLGARKLVQKKSSSRWLGGEKLRLGPNKNPQFLYVLMDRALIYCAHMVNRPHGRRDETDMLDSRGTARQGYTTVLTPDQKKICERFLKTITGASIRKEKGAVPDFEALICSLLNEMV